MINKSFFSNIETIKGGYMELLKNIISDHYFWVGICAGFVLASLMLSSNSNDTKTNCEFCKQRGLIISFHKGAKEETKRAKYCPECGRKLHQRENDDYY